MRSRMLDANGHPINWKTFGKPPEPPKDPEPVLKKPAWSPFEQTEQSENPVVDDDDWVWTVVYVPWDRFVNEYQGTWEEGCSTVDGSRKACRT
jgi:hypothetical protein